MKKINFLILFDFTQQLTVLKLERVDLTNQNVSALLKLAHKLRLLSLARLNVDLDHLNECLAASTVKEINLDSLTPGNLYIQRI